MATKMERDISISADTWNYLVFSFLLCHFLDIHQAQEHPINIAVWLADGHAMCLQVSWSNT